MKNSIFIALYPIIITLIINIPNYSFACKCAFSSIQDKYKQNSNIFIGTINNIKDITDISNLPIASHSEFTVSKIYKGNIDKIININIEKHSCGLFFNSQKEWKKEEKWLVFASDDGNTNICSGTKLLSLAQKDLAILDQLQEKN